ncbi:MAG: alpha/beta hydrolase [Pirellulales bacterium]|nr:alpha/beta hydrolase [Pirellulales bacterium]
MHAPVDAEDQPVSEVTPEVVYLWPDGAPGAVGNEPLDQPRITVYLPPADKATGAAVVVCPGGGYQHLAVTYEGHDVARWLNTLGVAGMVLEYRLAPRYHHPAPLQDVQRALRTVRAQASEWHLKADRIGVLGFSAGGHLASTAATHFDAGDANSTDAVERQSSRPDFAILCYPVISFTSEAVHSGSRKNLLGENPDAELIKSLSNELQVTAETPPTFLVHSAADKPVPPENSILFFQALRKAGVPGELLIFEQGPHGFGLGKDDPALTQWPKVCAEWMAKRGLLTP